MYGSTGKYLHILYWPIFAIIHKCVSPHCATEEIVSREVRGLAQSHTAAKGEGRLRFQPWTCDFKSSGPPLLYRDICGSLIKWGRVFLLASSRASEQGLPGTEPGGLLCCELPRAMNVNFSFMTPSPLLASDHPSSCSECLLLSGAIFASWTVT